MTFSENFDIIFIVNEKRNEKIEVHFKVFYFILQGAVATVATSIAETTTIKEPCLLRQLHVNISSLDYGEVGQR